MDGSCSASGPERPVGVDILAALEKMMRSEALRLSERNRRFLSFVVQKAIDGSSDRIKAYAIGVDVFGRDDTFDPTVDPIVRIEATRLRTALTAYYEGPGRDDAIVITMPKGSYVPSFSCRSLVVEQSEASALGVNSLSTGATVVINDRSHQIDAETALRGELFVDALLLSLQDAAVRVRLNPTRKHSAAAEAIDALFAEPGNACSLEVAVRSSGEKRRFTWRLIDLLQGEVLASQTRELVAQATPCFDSIDAIAADAAIAIVAALGRRERPFL